MVICGSTPIGPFPFSTQAVTFSEVVRVVMLKPSKKVVLRISSWNSGGFQDVWVKLNSKSFGWMVVVVGEDTSRVIRNGQPVFLEELVGEEGVGPCRAYTTDGCFLAVLVFRTETGQWHPEKVFAD